ncbi:MAG TPA: hypothetical protein VNK03_03970 [Gammaproteobacteria bacterium]|nr:hypothetical protein [Gammaproteobacteria bacterium]
MNEIAILKKYISEAKILSEPVSYFFDLIDQNIILNAAGTRKVNNLEKHPDLCMAINAAIDLASKFLNEKINISNPIFTEVSEEKFFHGCCTISNHPIPFLVLYCADLQVGISALSDSNNHTNFFRFFLTTAKDLKNKH